jgi:colicin import membrane protein
MRGLRCAPLTMAWMLATQCLAADDDSAERTRITAERAAVEARFAERERECASRFVVTACVEEAQREQRAALTALRQQQSLLDEAQRKQRAAERLDRLSKPHKNEPQAHEAAAPRVARQARAASLLNEPLPQPKASKAARPRKPETLKVPVDPLARRAREAGRQADFAARTQAAQAHRQAVEQRQAERLKKKGSAAQPLPLPAGAAAP